LGDFNNWGTPPVPQQEVSCTSFSATTIIPYHKYCLQAK
jgi:hypothetical protein